MRRRRNRQTYRQVAVAPSWGQALAATPVTTTTPQIQQQTEQMREFGFSSQDVVNVLRQYLADPRTTQERIVCQAVPVSPQEVSQFIRNRLLQSLQELYGFDPRTAVGLTLSEAEMQAVLRNFTQRAIELVQRNNANIEQQGMNVPGQRLIIDGTVLVSPNWCDEIQR